MLTYFAQSLRFYFHISLPSPPGSLALGFSPISDDIETPLLLILYQFCEDMQQSRARALAPSSPYHTI